MGDGGWRDITEAWRVEDTRKAGSVKHHGPVQWGTALSECLTEEVRDRFAVGRPVSAIACLF